MIRLQVIGNMVTDPSRKVTKDGTPLVYFTLAENRKRNGEDKATFFDCAVWSERMADNVMQYTHKGDTVYVAGEVDARAYTNKAGEPRASMSISVREIEFLMHRKKTDEPQPQAVEEDYIPF